jgi:predicted amidohydrolase YtcJ
MKRRNFITASTLAGAGVTLSPAAFLHAANSSGPLQADLLIKSARVYTMDGSRPLTESVAILGDRIIATGSNNDLKSLEGPSTRVIDGTDATITPGFIDAHSHPDGADEVSGTDVNLRSVAEIKTAMHAQAAVTPPGQWVIGYKYDDTKLSEGRPVHRRDLDEAVPQQPAIVRHRGGHTAVVNSKGLELAGIKAKTPDPEGGSYGREDGELTGFVAEKAFYEVILKAGEWPPRHGRRRIDLDHRFRGFGRKSHRLPGRP